MHSFARLLIIGSLLRGCKELWRDCILLACAVELAVTSDQRASTAGAGEGPQQQESGVKRTYPYSAAEEAVDNAAKIASDVNAPIFEDCVLRYTISTTFTPAARKR
jgi:hypothetical protein